ncbi:Uncharacterized protein APZ42_012403 [Daphnia magna]|uniref:Uncharacterized protein n=1 Tax=Daphnia magna TaxID=35525 RepID=A0A162RSK5_9CRUS|nr:Uncharacterized protein APZ42_012403 [Daphnia magna]
MPQLAEVSVVSSVVAMDEMSWSTVGGHKIGHWFASLGSRGRGRRKAAAVAAAAAAANCTNNAVANNNTTRSFTLGKMMGLPTFV